MTREGRVFQCTWKRARGGFKVWVAKRPRLAATGRTFHQADEALADVIANRTGDGENLREYSPSIPSPGAPGDVLQVAAMVSGEGRTTAGNEETLFSRGFCPQCSHPRGSRTKVGLVISSSKGLGDGGAARLTREGVGSSLALFSRDFLSLLTPKERHLFEWRKVAAPGRARKEFFELISADVQVPFVVLAGGSAELWTCDTCGWENSPFYGLADQFPEWLSEVVEGRWDDLPNWFVSSAALTNVSSCFAVGRAQELRLCFKAERWQELVGRAGTRGLKSYDIGILDPGMVEARPTRQKHSVIWG
jgi:hypothetical protein